jgi:hypothetical protein
MKLIVIPSLVLIAGGLFLSFAETVSLTGTVRDSATRAGVAGAQVSLAVAGLSTLTDTNGVYVLTGSGLRPVRQNAAPASKLPVVGRGGLEFGVDGSETVHIDVFDALGMILSPHVEARPARGTYRFYPGGSGHGAGLCFVRLRVGAFLGTFRVLFVKDGAREAAGLRAVADASGALAKTAAAIDTLVVSAGGHASVRKAIAAYAGANDFLLAASGGHAASILFPNGSYQSCIVPLVITVVDSQVSAASVRARVKSTSDPKGFSVTLAAVAGAVATYADSISFSIAKSDSIKKTIYVADGDNVTAVYTASPTQVDSVSTTWNGVAGTVQPGGSPVLGVVRPLSIHVWDSDVADSTVAVHVSSLKDKTGFSVALHAAGGSDGDFYGHIWFSLKGSTADSVLAVMGSLADTISIIYHDLTPVANVAAGACIWQPVLGIMFLDSSAYHGTASAMTINLSDDDIADSTAIVNVRSKKDPTGISDTLHVSGTTIRNFTGTVGFTTGLPRPGFIAVQDEDSVVVSYQDDSPVQTVTQSAAWISK